MVGSGNYENIFENIKKKKEFEANQNQLHEEGSYCFSLILSRSPRFLLCLISFIWKKYNPSVIKSWSKNGWKKWTKEINLTQYTFSCILTRNKMLRYFTFFVVLKYWMRNNYYLELHSNEKVLHIGMHFLMIESTIQRQRPCWRIYFSVHYHFDVVKICTYVNKQEED